MRSTLLALALLVTPTLATAATLTVDETKFHRENDDNDTDNPDPDAGDPRRRDATGEFGGINLDECTRGEIWHFEATTQGYSGKTLFVYTGTSCGEQDRRDGTGIDCKALDRVTLASDSTELHEFDFPANEIANVDGSDCDGLDDTLKVWFLVMESASDETPLASVGTPSAGDIRVLTIPPTAPSNLRTGPGEDSAEVNWDGAVEGENYYVACSPPPGDQETSDATPEFDAEGQELCTGEPPTAGFEAGATFQREWRCDSSDPFAQGTSTESASVNDLRNGVQYHFAAVAVDEVGNTSVLSELACATPAPVDDFFELYRRNGGKGGGGLCSAGPGVGHAGMGGALFLLVAAWLGARRRSR